MNGPNFYIEMITRMLIFFGPLNLVALFGLLWALMRRRRYGRTAQLIAIGNGFVLSSVFALLAMLILERMFGISFDLKFKALRTDHVGLFIWSLITSIGIGFILSAVYSGRSAEPRSPNDSQ